MRASGRPCELLVIQKSGGTRSTIASGRAWVENAVAGLQRTPRAPLEIADLVIATECGGSDATSGLTANPAIGIACDHVIEAGGTAIFEELGELFGCEEHMAQRALTPGSAKRSSARWSRRPATTPPSTSRASAAATSPAASRR